MRWSRGPDNRLRRPVSRGVRPNPIIAAKEDEATGCFQTYTRSDVIRCEYGPNHGATRRVALVGDSHAYQWRSPIEELARQRNWHVDIYGMAGCPFAKGIQVLSIAADTPKP